MATYSIRPGAEQPAGRGLLPTIRQPWLPFYYIHSCFPAAFACSVAQTHGAAGSSATPFLPSGSACQFGSFCPPTDNFTFSPFLTRSHSPDRPGWSLWPVPPFPLPSHFHLSRPGCRSRLTGRSRLISSFLLLPSPFFLFSPLTLSPLLPPRARRPPWEIQSDLADALPSWIHKRFYWPPARREQAASTGESRCASFSRWRTTLVYLCLAVPRLGSPLELRWTSLLHCRALSRLRPELSGFWEDSETARRDRPRFTSAFSHQDQWWLIKLRLRSPPSGNTRRFTRMHTSTFSLLGAFPSLPYTYPFLPLLPSPPRHSSRVYTQWHSAQSPKLSLWPLVTGIHPIPSAGSVSDGFPSSCMRLYTPNYLLV